MKVKDKATSEKQNAENPVEENVVAAPKENTETPEVSSESVKKTDEVPNDVDNILKQFSQYNELYIGGHGEVFTKDTPEFIRKDAVLYVNKYYKS